MILALAGIGSPVAAETLFDVPSQNLTQALTMLAGQAEIQFLYDSRLTSGKISIAVKGEPDIHRALTTMLDGSGLTFDFINARTIHIRKQKEDRQSPAAPAAQDGEPPPATVGDAEPDRRINDTPRQPLPDEILVTTRKRTERLQDVPLAISAFTADDIENAGIESVADLELLVPGMSFIPLLGSLSSSIVIRGVSTNIGEANVGIFIDGVYQSSRATIETLFDNIGRVEVSRGPQSALYGRNTFGGAINFITRRPTNAYEGSLRLGYGSHGTREVSLNHGGPLIADKLYYRLGMSHREADGFFINEVTQGRLDYRRSRFYSGSLELRPSADVDIVLRSSYEDTKNGDYPLRFVANDSSFVATPPPGGFRFHHGAVPNFTDGFAVTPGILKRDNLMHSLTVTWDMDKVTATSISAYNRLDIDSRVDNDYSPANLSHRRYEMDQDEFSQELRLSSASTTQLAWMVGIFYYRLELDATDEDRYLDPVVGAQVGHLPGASALLFNEERTESQAIFGQLNYQINDRFEFTLEGRYAWEAKGLDAIDFDPDLGFLRTDLLLRDDFTSFTPRATLQYHATPDVMLYMSLAKAVKAGGFNVLPAVTDAERRYDQETSWNYELGAKTSWFDRRLTVNLAGFWIDWTDQIVRTLGSSGALLNANAGESTSRGLEIEAFGRPVDGLELHAGFAFTDATYDRYILPALDLFGVATDLRGVALQNVSKYQANISIQYDHPLSDGLNWINRIALSYRSKQNALQSGHSWVGGQGNVNVRSRIETPTFSLTFWVRNLLNDRSPQSAIYLPSRRSAAASLSGASIELFNALITVAEPRSWGLTGQVHF